jgi:hypothetical protein
VVGKYTYNYDRCMRRRYVGTIKVEKIKLEL